MLSWRQQFLFSHSLSEGTLQVEVFPIQTSQSLLWNLRWLKSICLFNVILDDGEIWDLSGAVSPLPGLLVLHAADRSWLHAGCIFWVGIPQQNHWTAANQITSCSKILLEGFAWYAFYFLFYFYLFIKSKYTPMCKGFVRFVKVWCKGLSL